MHLIFQPAEEAIGGADLMIKDGLFEQFPCERIFGLHNMPGLPVGKLGFYAGNFMASADTVKITITGYGGHGAHPERTSTRSSPVAALVMVSYFGSARSDLGRDLLMPALTAAVLGGANIYGGSGSILGTALAALLVGYLQQGLQMVGIPNQVSSALSGALLVVVVMGRSLSLHREWVRATWRRLFSHKTIGA